MQLLVKFYISTSPDELPLHFSLQFIESYIKISYVSQTLTFNFEVLAFDF